MTKALGTFRFYLDGNVYVQDLEIRDGSITGIGKAVISESPRVREIKKRSPAPKLKPCCGVSIVKWLGLRWYGEPMPRRWWKRWRTGMRGPWKGCGCLVKPKEAWVQLGVLGRQFVRACKHVWSV